MRIVFTILLLILIGCSVFFTVSTFNTNKSELAIQVADYFNRLALPFRILELESLPPDQNVLIPVHGVTLNRIADTWGDARSEGRTHEGVDIFAPRGTPVYSATRGFVTRVGTNELGGNIVFVTGAGGRRYYYAHLDRVATELKVGDEVSTDTVLGFVGTTGNAENTPPHLHFGMYYERRAHNPYPLLIDR